MYEKMKQQLKSHEGLRLKMYKDTKGILTIGYGRNLKHVGISEAEAEILFENDAQIALRDLKQILPYAAHFNEARHAVLANMMFNLGVTRFLKFKRMIEALKNNDFEEAAEEMKDSDWYKQVGKRAVQLCEQMRTGKFV